jgi:soluble lytic murein transglycosylase-like protein
MWAMGAAAQVFVGTAPPGGSLVLSNFQSEQAPALLLPSLATSPPVPRLPPEAPGGPAAVLPLPAKAKRLRPMVEGIASAVQVSPDLIHAVISAESNYDARAVSPRGARGLMQLMPATARRFGLADPFVERDNVYAGARYLKWLLDYFSGDLELALAGYNAGEQAVVRAGRKIPQYPETQAYVRRVIANLKYAAPHTGETTALGN